jgi:murein L,D-transpeptidase YcbB/YkuD
MRPQFRFLALTLSAVLCGDLAHAQTSPAPNWRADIAKLYASADSRSLWFNQGKPTVSLLATLAELQSAADRGLEPLDYGATQLRADIAALTDPDPAALLALDRRISAAVARYVSDLHFGRIAPRNVGHDLDIPHAVLDTTVALRALAGSRDVRGVMRDYEPALYHYDLLKTALLRYRELANDPSLTALPPLGARSIKLDEPYAGAAALRRLLDALGDLKPGAPPSSSDTHLDAGLVAGLKEFQDRHGLPIDGALGRTTFAALTLPLARRVQQIELSLERARWLPPRLDTPPIIVNIPQFRLFAFRETLDREDSLLQMRVVVGKTFPRNNTPVFAADMRYLVLRPYWDVPATITRNELLPKFRNNPGWLTRNGFEIVAGQGDDSPVVSNDASNVAALAAGRLRLRQRPGPDNALGVAKFMFPNRYNVYLHGTTTQGLFAEARRAFSHGCIRLEDPLHIAEFLLRDRPEWPRSAIDVAATGTRPTRIHLAQPVRVMIVYATAIATEAGNVLFFEDIYGHDARLLTALQRRAAST